MLTHTAGTTTSPPVLRLDDVEERTFGASVSQNKNPVSVFVTFAAGGGVVGFFRRFISIPRPCRRQPGLAGAVLLLRAA